MTNVLRKLFDYQKFEMEPGLQKVIDDTIMNSKVIHLADEDLDMVAAGTDNVSSGNEDMGETVPFSCNKCGTVFDIKLGVKEAVCPTCRKTHTING